MLGMRVLFNASHGGRGSLPEAGWQNAGVLRLRLEDDGEKQATAKKTKQR